MEDFAFTADGILTEEEAQKLFENDGNESEETEQFAEETETENELTDGEDADGEETESESTQETVGEEEDEDDAVSTKGSGTSPSVYSSIAAALKEDGIFPDFDDKEINGVQSPDDFAELFDKAVNARLDEQQKRVATALGYGVAPDTVRMYEQTLQYLGSINEEVLKSDGEDGENLRKQLIWNDLKNRGYSDEKASKKLQQSFDSGNDKEDAADALEALQGFYQSGYAKAQNDAKIQANEAKRALQKQADDFKKMVIDSDVKIGETVLDKQQKQRVYDVVTKPVYKDPNTGKLLTEIQKFQSEHPLEFLKQVGMWWVMTNGGKDTKGLVKAQLRTEKNKGIRELERKINSSSFNSDGSLRYAAGSGDRTDPLLSDDWKVGFGK